MNGRTDERTIYAVYIRYTCGEGSGFELGSEFKVISEKPDEEVIDILWDSLKEIEYKEREVSIEEIWRAGSAYECEVETVFLATQKFWVVERRKEWRAPQEWPNEYYHIYESRGPFKNEQEALITVVRDGRKTAT
jgi:hypothetical protein